MNHSAVISELTANRTVFASLLNDVPHALVHWRPAADKWSLLEIVNHLCDEETEDFGYRLRAVLENPVRKWPPIDPEKWVTERKYAKRDYTESVGSLLQARKKSVDWLNRLQKPDWQAAYNHPQMGKMNAEMILTNWLAHDYLHIRQIIANRYVYLSRSSGINLEYAGLW